MNNTVLTVLVVDDDHDVCDFVARVLLGTEFHVIQAFSGREGVQRAKEHKPDIILLDIMMPTIDGFMTGKIIKRNLSTKDIPIIFLSGKKSKQDITTAIQTGGVDYIVKPFSPNDLLTRIRRAVTLQETLKVQKRIREERLSAQDKGVDDNNGSKLQILAENTIIRYGDVIVCSGVANSIVLGNCIIYRGVFANIVSDGIFKVVLDTSNIEAIDSAGVALLVSVNESLKSYGGELRITIPNPKVNNNLSYVKMIELFQGFETIPEAINSFQDSNSYAIKGAGQEDINICISCTYANSSNARYCMHCGTNLIMGRGEKIFEALKNIISDRIVNETQASNISELNKNRNFEAEKYDIPSEFNVELYEENFALKYKSFRTVRLYFETKGEIGLQLPLLYGKIIRLRPGMKLQLSGTHSGAFSNYETEVRSIDEANGLAYVHYSEEAKIIMSQKNFSIAPNLPIPVSLINPSFANTGSVINGKILELSRVRIVIFSEEFIPEDECLAINFTLPDGNEISSPLVVAKKRRERFMYNIEFVIIDENERAKITRYMYKRQIELANK